MASLVTADTVFPLRAASCRNFASSSSGSFTVVLFMICQHTYSQADCRESEQTQSLKRLSPEIGLNPVPSRTQRCSSGLTRTIVERTHHNASQLDLGSKRPARASSLSVLAASAGESAGRWERGSVIA